MQHEVVYYDASVGKDLDIKLLLEDLLEQSDSLRCIKPLKVVLSGNDEGQGLEFVLQVHHHLNLFSLPVEDTITEMDKD